MKVSLADHYSYSNDSGASAQIAAMTGHERYARFLTGKLLAKRKKSIKIFNFARFGRFDTILDVEF